MPTVSNDIDALLTAANNAAALAALGAVKTPFITKKVIDDASDIYANGDAAADKIWIVSSGTGTSSGDGNDHTLTATTGGSDTVFKRDISLDAQFSAFEFEFERDVNLSQIRFALKFGTQAALKTFNLPAWGVAGYLYTGKYVKVVVPVADMDYQQTAGWTQDMLKNAKELTITIRPNAATNTAIKLRKVTHIQSDGIGRVCFQFDDNLEDTHTVAAPILAANGFAGDIAVEHNSIGTATRGTLVQLQARYAEGWGMMGHDISNFTILTSQQQVDLHKAIKDVLRTNGFQRGSDCLVWPGGIANEATDEIASRFWRVRRRVARLPEMAMIGAYDPAQPSHFYMGSSTLAATIKAKMDLAKAHGATVVLVFHSIVTPAAAATDVTVEVFTEVVEYAAQIGLIDTRYADVFSEQAAVHI